jgi:hypothetical protein
MRGPLPRLVPVVLLFASCSYGNTEGTYDSTLDSDADADTDSDTDTDNGPCSSDEVLQPGTDNLCWAKCPYGATFDGTVCQGGTPGTWAEALGTCGNKGNGSHVPMADELIALLGGCDSGASTGQGQCDACSSDCGENPSKTCTSMFFNDNQTYWSCTAWMEDFSMAITVDFCTGLVAPLAQKESIAFRCLREAND